MSECTRLFQEADLDSNGTLDYGEFEAWLRSALQMNASPAAQQRRAVDEEAARAAFASADRDCDGHLTVEELRFAYAGMLLSAGQKVSRKRVARWAARSIRKYDADNSRTLEFEEFFELLRKVRFADGLQLH
ncbi:unnamed protein product [Prorocentrum cordatum]|uniref:EF-hand domain-containing protein n=1 Tax=Prorocentrum cordatum TaxID=2364126 RepID=A0ABN9U8E4_9DINO|nr:unnamed protein product [Polarella glacialis]